MKTILISIALLCLPISAFAFGSKPADIQEQCKEQAENFYRDGKNHLVVTFEGLAMPSESFVYRGLIEKLQNTEIGSTFAVRAHRYKNAENAMTCIREWVNIHHERLNLTLIGHSFGGGIAVQSLLKTLKQENIKVKHVITLDPRDNSSSIFSCRMQNPGNEKYTRPSHVGQYINFYQCGGGLPGERVSGAENIEIERATHGNLPSQELVFKRVKELFEAL
ncbi:MAG: hypothetical protein M9962_13095 [Oligoflexia bacterium]|nr:hypothetical protein [Oligoflexia bacterium]